MDNRPITAQSYALVTGASSGMGREYARMLFNLEYNLIIVSNQDKELNEVREELQKRLLKVL